MSVVRGERVDLRAVGVERDGEVPSLGDPEVAVEAALEIRRLLLQLVRERGVLPDLAREPSSAHLRVVGVALELAGRAREAREAARRGTRSSPRSPSSTGSRAQSPRSAAGTRRSRCPGGRRTRRSSSAPRERLLLEVADELAVARPALVLVQQDDVQRRGVGSSRSTASAAAPRRRSARRSASRAGSGRGPRRGSRRCASPAASRARAASSPPARARTAAPAGW